MIHQAKVIVGVGRFGFVAGPYAYLNSSVAVARGSSLGIVQCRQATLTMYAGAGVGYAMPQPVTNAINAVLRAMNIGEIKASGGLDTKPMLLVNTGNVSPAVRVCGAEAGLLRPVRRQSEQPAAHHGPRIAG